jgi:hypothetical protein
MRTIVDYWLFFQPKVDEFRLKVDEFQANIPVAGRLIRSLRYA